MKSFLFIFHIWLRQIHSRAMSAITHNLKYAILSLLTVTMAIASFVILLKFPKFNSAWLLIAGAAIGWLLKQT